MGLFVEGQDPLDQTQGPATIQPTGAPQPSLGQDFNSQPVADTIAAAFRQANPVSAVLDAVTRESPGGAYDPSHNPLDDIRGTDLEQNHLNAFLDSPNEQATQATIASIRRDETDRQTLAASGGVGIAATVAAGLADPSWYIPFVGEARAGAGLAEVAGRAAALGALQSGVSEVAMHAAQPGREWTPQDGVNVASNTLLMGFLGGAMRLMSPGEIDQAEKDLDATRPRVTPVVDENGVTQPGYQGSASNPLPSNDNVGEMGGGLATSAGAAASDTRNLDPVSYGLDRVPWLGRQLNKVSPNTRVFFNSGSVQTKRAMADLAENAFRFEDSGSGVPTALGGPPVESDLRSLKNQFEVSKQQIIEHNWVQHRYGANPPNAVTLAAAHEGIGAPTANGKLSIADFKTAMYDAGINGDVHDVPEVQTAAQQLRAQVLDPIQKMAQETIGPDGQPMLADALQPPKGDASFMPRQWNTEALQRNYGAVRDDWTNWLGEEQASNATTRDKISALNDRHTFLGDQVSKLEGRLSTIRNRRALTESALNERVTELNSADARETALSERRTSIGEGISELQEFISSMRDESRDPTVIDRVNELQQQLTKLRRDSGDTGETTGELGALDTKTPEAKALKDRNTAQRAEGREAIREGEAGVAVNRSEARFETLRDRTNRQQVIEDLLESARQNAAGEQARIRSQLEDELKNWRGNSAAEALKGVEDRTEAERVRGLKQQAGIYQGNGERLTGADSAIDRAVKRILASETDKSPGELRDRAQQILNRIISTPDGRIPYDAPSGGPKIGVPGETQEVRGSLNAREFAIPTARVAKYVERDIDHVITAHLRTALPDILLTRRFGDVDMTDQMRKIVEEADAQIKPGMSEKQQKAVLDARDGNIRDLAAVRDRVRGVYGWDPNSRKMGAMIRDMQNLNALSSLGTSVFNRLTDFAANATYRYGFMNVFRDQWQPLLQAMVGQTAVAREAKTQALDAGIGADGLLGHMRNNLYDINNSYRPGNKFSRGLAWATDKSMLVNMHGPWTDWNKALAWNVAQGEFGRAAARIAAGKGTQLDISRMAEASIDPALATRISGQYEKFHTLVKGRKFANVADWTDDGARRAFNAAMSREANSVVLTAGAADKPLWMSKPLYSLIGQFHSFTAAAHEKILISNLQRRDGNSLQGMMMSVAMGMLSYRLYTMASGQDVSANPADWVKEGISRSAMTGWLSDANMAASKFTSGAVDYNRLYGATMPDTRHRDLSLADVLGGPTYARANSLLGVVDHASAGKFSAADIHQMRMALPLQNLAFFRRLLDQVEGSTAGALGIQPRQPPISPY